MKTKTIIKFVFSSLFFLSLFFSSCHSDTTVLGKVWRYSSYSYSMDMSKPPAPPVIPPLPTMNREKPTESYSLVKNFIQRKKNNEETYIKFEGELPASDAGKFTQFNQDREEILSGKLSYNFDNEEKKLALEYGNLWNNDEYLIKKVTKDSLVLGFKLYETINYNVVFVWAK